MEVCYVVTFKPQEVRTYAAELVVVTEREKFIVPVGALGHRAVLDFPDQASERVHLFSKRLQHDSRACLTIGLIRNTATVYHVRGSSSASRNAQCSLFIRHAIVVAQGRVAFSPQSMVDNATSGPLFRQPYLTTPGLYLYTQHESHLCVS